MKKNVALPISALKTGDEGEIAKYGAKDMSLDEISQRNADEIAHADYVETEKYRDDRRVEYPAIGDQIDALWAAVEALGNGDGLPQATAEMLDAIKAVKAKYPKPDTATLTPAGKSK